MDRIKRILRICVSVLTWMSSGFMLLVPLWFLLAALGTKWEFWSWHFGLETMVHSAGFWLIFTCLVTGVLALAAILVHRLMVREWFGVISPSVWAVLIGVGGLIWLYALVQARETTPPLLDVTTDLVDPPHFSASFVDRRDPTLNSLDYNAHVFADGRSYRAVQAETYPHIASWVSDESSDALYRRAISQARFLGWRIGTASEPAGMFEASTESFWFGFKDDVVVRIRARETGGSVLDVRSVARDYVHDLGRNANRVEDFLERLEEGPA